MSQSHVEIIMNDKPYAYSNNNNGIASCLEREQSPTKVHRLTADKLLSYAAHDGERETTIHPRMSLPRGEVGMGDIPATNTVK